MRVGLVCPYSLDVHGGVQSHVLGLAEALTARGHHVGVVAPGETGVVEDHPAYVTTTGRAVPMPYNGSVARVSFGPLVAARVRRWLERGAFDVVHLHEPVTPSLSVLALWAAREPVVATFHTSQGRGWALGTSAATFLKPGLRKVAAHIAVSEEAGRTMTRYLTAEPVLIPNGLHTAGFGSHARGRSHDPSIVFVGRIDEPRKGLSVLLDALPRILLDHPKARLTVVGGGARPELPASLVRHVRFTGAVGEASKRRLVAAADVMVAPNTHGESFGVVLAEAMAAETAVAASDLPAFRAVLDDGQCGALFRVGDADHLATTVSELLAHPRRREWLVAEARVRVAAYDWSVVVGRVEEVYASVLGDRSAEAG